MQTYKSLFFTAAMVLSGLGFAGINSAAAQSFSIDWYTIDGGGGVSSAAGFELQGTIGQPDAGPTMSGGSFSLTGGFWAGANNNSVILGDVNGDGVVNLLDIAPFVEALSSGTFIVAADVNQDGVVNLLDIGPFVEILSS